jgi:hypothetical protein
MEKGTAKLKPGTGIWCRIESPEPGGYNVSIVASGLTGFLPSLEPIEVGRVVPTTLVCMDGERALFTFAFTMGTSDRVQHSKDSDQETAFNVWTDAYPSSYSLRRAVDLVMPPLGTSSIMIKLNERSAQELFPTLEDTNYTGCMKIYCESGLSRAALIILHGRVVGSVYTKKPVPDPYPFEIGIKKMLQDVTAPDAVADLEMYELPASLVLSMSSLFQGYIDLPQDQPDKLAYAEKMLAHFSASKQTACFNLLDSATDTPIALGFVCNGEFQGAYAIGERLFSEEKEFFFKLLADRSALKLQAHILPFAMTTDAVRFGYSLSSKKFAF